jgi:hypothetical protein
MSFSFFPGFAVSSVHASRTLSTDSANIASPVDFRTAGHIVDDDIYKILVKPMRAGGTFVRSERYKAGPVCRSNNRVQPLSLLVVLLLLSVKVNVTVLIDACHSGTAMDL